MVSSSALPWGLHSLLVSFPFFLLRHHLFLSFRRQPDGTTTLHTAPAPVCCTRALGLYNFTCERSSPSSVDQQAVLSREEAAAATSLVVSEEATNLPSFPPPRQSAVEVVVARARGRPYRHPAPAPAATRASACVPPHPRVSSSGSATAERQTGGAVSGEVRRRRRLAPPPAEDTSRRARSVEPGWTR